MQADPSRRSFSTSGSPRGLTPPPRLVPSPQGLGMTRGGPFRSGGREDRQPPDDVAVHAFCFLELHALCQIRARPMHSPLFGNHFPQIL